MSDNLVVQKKAQGQMATPMSFAASSPVVGRLILWIALLVVVLAVPHVASPFALEVASHFMIAAIAALALMVLTGFAGQISLGHSGLLAAGAFTVAVLYREFGAPFWIGLPAAVVTGAIIGLIFGLPSLRVRGIYLAVSTMALHFVIIYLGSEYEYLRGFSTGISVAPPTAFGIEFFGGEMWFYPLFILLAGTYWVCHNLIHSRIGRAWEALHAKETVAEAIGVEVANYKLFAFVFSSAMTAFAGGLLAYYQGFVSVEAFSFHLTIQYIAMIIVGGMGTLVGALLGAAFIILLPYAIEWAIEVQPFVHLDIGLASFINYTVFGVLMLFFLLVEPRGLIGLWHRGRHAVVRRFAGARGGNK